MTRGRGWSGKRTLRREVLSRYLRDPAHAEHGRYRLPGSELPTTAQETCRTAKPDLPRSGSKPGRATEIIGPSPTYPKAAGGVPSAAAPSAGPRRAGSPLTAAGSPHRPALGQSHSRSRVQPHARSRRSPGRQGAGAHRQGPMAAALPALRSGSREAAAAAGRPERCGAAARRRRSAATGAARTAVPSGPRGAGRGAQRCRSPGGVALAPPRRGGCDRAGLRALSAGTIRWLLCPFVRTVDRTPPRH